MRKLALVVLLAVAAPAAAEDFSIVVLVEDTAVCSTSAGKTVFLDVPLQIMEGPLDFDALLVRMREIATEGLHTGKFWFPAHRVRKLVAIPYSPRWPRPQLDPNPCGGIVSPPPQQAR